MAAAAPQTSAPAPQLDWDTFFKLRKTRRRWQLLFSVTMLGASSTAGAILLASGAGEAAVTKIPLDPFITLGFMVMGCGALGWLGGPSIGSGVFYLLNKRWKSQMTRKENEFFARIKRNRVDPTNSSAGNPGTLHCEAGVFVNAHRDQKLTVYL